MNTNEPKPIDNRRQRGRPTMLGEKMVQTAVWLPREQLEWLKLHGNVSEQIRTLVEREMKSNGKGFDE